MIYFIVGSFAVILLIVFIAMFSFMRRDKNNYISKEVVNHFTPKEDTDDLTDMIEYHQKHGTTRYDL